jgi:hypothetical protein
MVKFVLSTDIRNRSLLPHVQPGVLSVWCELVSSRETHFLS